MRATTIGVVVEYMLFICTDPTAPAYVAAEDNIAEWGAEMETRGVARHGDRLRPVEDATTVTVREIGRASCRERVL